MLDATLRAEEIARAGKEAEVAACSWWTWCWGMARCARSGGRHRARIEAAQAQARAHRRGLAVVASVVGTARATRRGSTARWRHLSPLGAWVLPSNAQAARAAAAIAGGPRVAERPSRRRVALMYGDP